MYNARFDSSPGANSNPEDIVMKKGNSLGAGRAEI